MCVCGWCDFVSITRSCLSTERAHTGTGLPANCPFLCSCVSFGHEEEAQGRLTFREALKE